MKLILDFVNKTLKGGLFFLIPLVLAYMLLGKAIHLIQPLANKLAGVMDPAQENFLDFSYIVAVILLVIICFVFGLMASSVIGADFVRWIENHILVMFPAYRLMKNTFESAAGITKNDKLPVVLVPIDGLMLAFLIDDLPDGDKLVFVPGSPDPWSGNLIIFKKEQVKETGLTQPEALRILKQTGIGEKQIIAKGVYGKENI
ncbi:DUF502 domain-containing protein [Echinicola sp. 20G]|uniref:DUF502 domain-containing protein n=1 Tax=Echinicola sp. 20G TaxID=2781961 RepID=UPI00191020B8|nr:DUF502 domain-containing protein [Echinicola sp. 20G]